MAGLGHIRVWQGKQVEDRVRLMFGQVQKSLRWPQTRMLATQMVLEGRCPSQNWGDYDRVEIDKCQIAAIFSSFKQHGYYLGDIYNIDTYQTLQRMHESSSLAVLAKAVGLYVRDVSAGHEQDLRALGVGGHDAFRRPQFIYDCDDATIGLMALLGSIGFRVGCKVIGQSADTFNHVYALTQIPRYVAGPKAYVALDATEPESFPGWEPEPYTRRAERIYWYEEAA